MPLVQQRGGRRAFDARWVRHQHLPSVTASNNARFTIGVLAGAMTFHLVSLATGVLAALAAGYLVPFTA
jgi:hypothetical protein